MTMCWEGGRGDEPSQETCLMDTQTYGEQALGNFIQLTVKLQAVP